MKALIASALVATAALTGAASASQQTGAPAARQILAVAPDADLTGLSAADLVAVAQVIAGTEGGAAQKAGTAKALIENLR